MRIAFTDEQRAMLRRFHQENKIVIEEADAAGERAESEDRDAMERPQENVVEGDSDEAHGNGPALPKTK